MRLPAYPKYRSSGVEWLGEVPEHWRTKRLKLSVRLRDHTVEADAENQKPYIGLENIESWTGRLLPIDLDVIPSGSANAFQSGNTLFGKLRPYLAKAANPGFDGLCSTEFLVLESEELSRRNLLYSLLSDGFIKVVDSSTFGSKMPRANWDFIGNCVLPIPSPDEQRGIADFLDRETARLDTLLGRKREVIEKLKEKRSALISRTVIRGLPAAAAAKAGLNPRPKLKPSGIEWLGDIPKHWKLTKLVFATKKIGDGLHGTPDYVEDSGIYFVNGNNLSAGKVTFFENTRQVSPDTYVTYKLPLGDATVLMSINGTIGNLAVYRGEEIVLGKSAAFINCDRTLDRLFLVKYLETAGVRSFFDLELTGTTIFNLSLESIRRTPISLPPLSEQRAISDYLDCETAKLDRMTEKVEAAGIPHRAHHRRRDRQDRRAWSFCMTANKKHEIEAIVKNASSKHILGRCSSEYSSGFIEAFCRVYGETKWPRALQRKFFLLNESNYTDQRFFEGACELSVANHISLQAVTDFEVDKNVNQTNGTDADVFFRRGATVSIEVKCPVEPQPSIPPTANPNLVMLLRPAGRIHNYPSEVSDLISSINSSGVVTAVKAKSKDATLKSFLVEASEKFNPESSVDDLNILFVACGDWADMANY